MSICSIEDVRSAAPSHSGSRLYVMRDRDFVESLIRRAIAAQCPRWCSRRICRFRAAHRDIKNGTVCAPRLTCAMRSTLPPNRPGVSVLTAPRRTFWQPGGARARQATSAHISQWIASQFDPTLSWQDVAWVRKLWPGKLIIKGILDADDARHASHRRGCDRGVEHAGASSNGAPSSIAALPGIVRRSATSPGIIRWRRAQRPGCFSRPWRSAHRHHGRQGDPV